MKIKFVPQEYTKLKDFCGTRIWEKPKEMAIYAIGADVAEGVGRDASCAQVINCSTGLVVANFWSNAIDVDSYSAELFKLGYYYNKATICVEANNHGHAVISHLSGAIGGLAYPNLYKRLVLDEYTQKKQKQIGFKTTVSTKPRIIENLKAALRDGEIIVMDKFTIQELSSFVRDDRGRLAAAGNAFDDRVMSLALAWEQARLVKENLKYTNEESNFKQSYDPVTGFPIIG